MLRGGLFTRYWLEDGIRRTAAYRALDAGGCSSFAGAVADRWAALAGMARPSEAETESEFIFPVLGLLGWHHLPQAQPGHGRRDVADALLFLTPAAKDTARREPDPAARFRHGAVVVENEARNTLLDRSGGKGEAPSSQILRYLKRADGIPGSAVRWGLLANGRFWRLYWSGAQARADGFFELDLPAVLDPLLPPPLPADASPDHWLRVFVLLFGRDAFAPAARGRTFLDDAMAEGRRYEERITDSLSEAVFDRVFPRLVSALAAADPQARPADATWREAVKAAALVLLFRFLFVLYAEDRDLLPVAHPGYRDYALRTLRDEAEAVAEDRLALSERRHSWWNRTTDLFRAIAVGDPALGLPAYNGGLFDDAGHPLLSRAAIPDAALAPILDDLSRAEAPRGPLPRGAASSTATSRCSSSAPSTSGCSNATWWRTRPPRPASPSPATPPPATAPAPSTPPTRWSRSSSPRPSGRSSRRSAPPSPPAPRRSQTTAAPPPTASPTSAASTRPPPSCRSVSAIPRWAPATSSCRWSTTSPRTR